MRATDPQVLHRLPKNVYLEYIKLFPITQSPEIRTYTTLIFTLIAIIGFSLFAISPTLRTIIELRKTLDDNEFANTALEEKIVAMQSLQQQYGTLGDSLERISAAIPTSPEAPVLLAKLQTLATLNQVRITKLETLEVELTKKTQRTTRPSSFVVNLTLSGTYDQTLRFLESLHTFDRVMTVDSMVITRDPVSASAPLTTNIRVRAYFHPEAVSL